MDLNVDIKQHFKLLQDFIFKSKGRKEGNQHYFVHTTGKAGHEKKLISVVFLKYRPLKICDIMEDLHVYAIKDKTNAHKEKLIEYQDSKTEEILRKLLCTRQNAWYVS
jgi:hypothetical protein